MDKFVILPERTIEDYFELFPLIFLIKRDFVNAEINLVCFENYSKDIFNFLPFKVKVHKVSSGDLGPLKSFRLAEKLNDIFNITHFINFSDDLGSLNFGKALKPNFFVGFKSIKSKPFYTSTIEKPTFQNQYKQYKYLYCESFKKEETIKAEPEQVLAQPENFFKSEVGEPFIFIPFLAKDISPELSEVLVEIARTLEGQRVIYWADEDCPLREDFRKVFPSFIDASEAPFASLDKYVMLSKGVLSPSRLIAQLSCYFGVVNFFLSISVNSSKNSAIYDFDIPIHELILKNKNEVVIDNEVISTTGLIDLLHKEFNL